MGVPLRIGLAGLGVHGERYARHLLDGDVAGARLTAVSRADDEAGRRFASRHDLAYVADPRELATHSGVDAVVAVLPPDLHAPVALACAAASRPALIEKPLATTGDAAAEIAREVEQRGSFLMVAHTLRYDAVVLALAAARASIGPLCLVSINQRFEPSDRPWIDTPGRGGLILNTGVHGFDLLRHLTGSEAVSVVAECSRRRTRDTEDQLVAAFRLEPGGILAVLDNTRSSRARSGRIELVGESGQLWGDHIHRTLHRVRGRDVEDLGPVPASPTVPATLAAFVLAVRNQSAPPIGAADGLAALRMADAVSAAAESGRRVPVQS